MFQFNEETVDRMGNVMILRWLVSETVALMENFAAADQYVINRFDVEIFLNIY